MAETQTAGVGAGPALVPPYPYFGSKRAVASLIWQALGNVGVYIEPFLGSASILLARPTAPHVETVNDWNCFLCNFWRALQHDPEGVAEWASYPVSECVPAGTMIATPNGEIPIEDIRPGMMVLGDQNGRIVPTPVVDVTQKEADTFYTLGPLALTANHPVWTAEKGYVEAGQLSHGLHVKKLQYPVCEYDLVMLELGHEYSTMGNLYPQRSTHQYSALCRHNLQEEATLQRTYVSGCYRGEDTPGLLDSVSTLFGAPSPLCSHRARDRRWMGGGRSTMDCPLSPANGFDELDGWGGGFPGLYSHTRIAPEMVSHAERGPLSSWKNRRNDRENTYTRGPSQNNCCTHGKTRLTGDAAQALCQCQEARDSSRYICTDASRLVGCATDRGFSTQGQNLSRLPKQTDSLCRNRRDFSIHPSSKPSLPCYEKSHTKCSQGRYSVQRIALRSPISVYNFQTITGNYFANRILVHNCDLHARHRWLMEQQDFREQLRADPFYYDVQIAGWWVWGTCAWIGHGWCQEGCEKERKRPDIRGERLGVGIHQQRPMVGGNTPGLGINQHKKRPMVAADRAARGIQGTQWRQRPMVAADRAARGIQGTQWRQRPMYQGDHPPGIFHSDDLHAWFAALATRLRRVRICCGDWRRVLTPVVLNGAGVTGIVLDPPYSQGERDKRLYGEQDDTIATEVAQWAREHGENPKYRIVLCGYDTEHEMPGWTKHAWQANGGYGNQRKDGTNHNRKREMLWLSPYCETITTQLSLFSLGGEEV